MRVLVVNDDHETMELMAMRLASAFGADNVQFVVQREHASSPLEDVDGCTALAWEDLTDENLRTYHVILMDYDLGSWPDGNGLSGLTLVAALRARGYTGVIIACSSDEGYNHDLVRAGATQAAAGAGKLLTDQIDRLVSDQRA